MENNRECYHCAGNHPELTVPLFEFGFGFAPDAADARKRAEAERYACLVTDRHAAWEATGLPSREIEHLADCATGYRVERLPLDGAGESHTRDTRIASRRLLGRLAEPELGALSVWTQPNSWQHFMSDHIVSFSVLPLSPERTLLRTKWLVHKDAVEGQDYDPANLTLVWDATNRQDASLQAGHFNDFVQVALVRAALYKALSEQGKLDHANMTRGVFAALGLDQQAYAKEPAQWGPERREMKRQCSGY